MQNIAVEKRYVNGGVRLSFFVQESDIKPGEYCLIPASEAEADKARIDELEKQLAAKDAENGRLVQERREWQGQLAERSPGVMPEEVRQLIDAAECMVADIPIHKDPVSDWVCAKKAVENLHETPGYRWEPVDAEHPITAADVGRRVVHRNGGTNTIDEFWETASYQVRIGKVTFTEQGHYQYPDKSPFDLTHILRPVAPKFVFTGEPGRYLTDNFGECDVVRTVSGEVRIMNADFGWDEVSSDGTFPGGRITGRVS